MTSSLHSFTSYIYIEIIIQTNTDVLLFKVRVVILSTLSVIAKIVNKLKLQRLFWYFQLQFTKFLYPISLVFQIHSKCNLFPDSPTLFMISGTKSKLFFRRNIRIRISLFFVCWNVYHLVLSNRVVEALVVSTSINNFATVVACEV